MSHSPSPAALPHPLVSGVEGLDAALDELTGLDPTYLTTDQRRHLLVLLARVGDRVRGLHARVVAASDDVARAEGHRDVAAWLTHRTRGSLGDHRRLERLARACDRRWTAVGDALCSGALTESQAHVVVEALDDLARAHDLADVDAATWRDVLARAEAHLLAEADTFGPRELRRLGERILEVVAPEHAEKVERERLERSERHARRHTRLTVRPLGDGTALVRGRIPEAAATRLRTALEAFTNPRSEQSSSPDSGERTSAPRLPYEVCLGRAFCSLLETLDPTRLPLHGGDATTLVVTIPLETLTTGLGTATLPDGHRIGAGEARRLACTARIVPAVLGSDSVPLDLGRAARLFSSGQRRALALRDRECRADGCTIPATWCEAHHLTPWSQGGRSDLTNGVLLCAHHHQRIHDAQYAHARLPDGTLRFTRRRP